MIMIFIDYSNSVILKFLLINIIACLSVLENFPTWKMSKAYSEVVYKIN